MDKIKDILEIINLLSGPAIAIIAVIALKQIKVAKDSTITSARRESLKLAAEQCKHYTEYIVPLENKLDDLIETNNITFFKKSSIEVSIEGYKASPDKKSYKEALKVLQESLDVINALESFSTFFVSGVASEKDAFISVGASFCHEVRMLLPLISILSREKYLRNLVALFLLWNNRLEKEQLTRDKNKLENKIGKIADREIHPLGTK